MREILRLSQRKVRTVKIKDFSYICTYFASLFRFINLWMSPYCRQQPISNFQCWGVFPVALTWCFGLSSMQMNRVVTVRRETASRRCMRPTGMPGKGPWVLEKHRVWILMVTYFCSVQHCIRTCQTASSEADKREISSFFCSQIIIYTIDSCLIAVYQQLLIEQFTPTEVIK